MFDIFKQLKKRYNPLGVFPVILSKAIQKPSPDQYVNSA